MTKNITLIIPTYERAGPLANSLRYWARYPVNLIVVDGSAKSISEVTSFVMPENVRYYHLPMSSIEARFAFVARELDGDCAALIPDDEFFSYSALVKAAEFLIKEEDYAAVLGATVAFTRQGDNIAFTSQYISAADLKIYADDPLVRIAQRLAISGNSIYYSLVKVDVMRLALELIGARRYSCPYIGEYQLEAAICFAGKVKFMPKLMWFRNRIEPPICVNGFDRSVYLSDWLEDPNNSTEIATLENDFECKLRRVAHSVKFSGSQLVHMFGRAEAEALQAGKQRVRIWPSLWRRVRQLANGEYQLVTRQSRDSWASFEKVMAGSGYSNVGYDRGDVRHVIRAIESGWFESP